MANATEAKKIGVFRQYGIAHSGFVADNNGNVVPVYDRSSTDPNVSQPGFKTLLLPYFGEKNQQGAFFKPVDISHPSYQGYDPGKPWNNGIGMNTRIVLPEKNSVNNWREGGPYKLFTITYPQYRVLFGDCTADTYSIDPLKLDQCLVTSRHGGGKKGMFVLFDTRVVLYTRAQAEQAMKDPSQVPNTPD
jgi:hypothetical protein